MTAPITHDQWKATRAAVRQTGDRFAEMVATTREPQARATADWSVADTAAHVAAIASMYVSVVRPGAVPLPAFAVEDRLLATTVDTVGELNDLTLRSFTERDPRLLAHRLRTDIDRLLRVSDGLDPAEPVTWLGGSRVPVAGVLAHLLNELLIHGRDIARAIGARWVIPARDAALFFELFVIGMVRHDVGRLLETDEPPRERRIAVEFRSRHTTPVTLVLRDGRVSVEGPGRGADVRLSFDPVTLNLMLFGRVSRARAALTGKVAVRGRRPWLLPAFLRTVRLPATRYPGPQPGGAPAGADAAPAP
ncbi:MULTISPECIES: maleylpyruvate isomerase family mycothiol-dependent enzyme [Streptosporangium]|uniref:Uncharacterized protein (TIGR03083 family) n=1 Tax=Streptosporangium brasiliense TaxID=47480 RepID=A0ABT9RFV9_9ACTN|nr:maleylpyruvate isomerase family mycothiol-dependent enzyme [Streptosporangium brasiliense]MDP9867742.1 uncharacterized protein (TIGR03083 family) [Streptosporangium brasiliense]